MSNAVKLVAEVTVEEVIPKFSLVDVMLKELLSQFSVAIVKSLTDEKLCDQERAQNIVLAVAKTFDAEVTLIRKQPRPKCSKCDSFVSKHSKSHLYCYKCAKDNDDIAEEFACIAPAKNANGTCGRKAYGSECCSIHKKWEEANKKGKICQYEIRKGAHAGKICRAIISDDSDEEYCSKHSRKGKCKGTNKEGNPCTFGVVEGEEYCRNHLNKKKPSKKDADDDAAEEKVEEKKHHHKKQQKKGDD
jgi:hypothetical protein